VFQYATSRNNFEIPLDNPYPEKLKEHVASLIHDTLNVNPSNRPSAKNLLTRFHSVIGDESDLDFDRETLETMEVSLEVLRRASQLRSIISRFDGQESVDQFLCLGTGKSGSVYYVFPIFVTRLIPG
jgi:serine/threonine protein kinase